MYLTDLDHDEVPALFWWFPNQDDFKPPPPSDETMVEKLERISATVKVKRKLGSKSLFHGYKNKCYLPTQEINDNSEGCTFIAICAL